MPPRLRPTMLTRFLIFLSNAPSKLFAQRHSVLATPHHAACLLLALLALAPAARAQYTFTLIANSGDPTFSAFGGAPSINTAGTVAFLATRDAGAGGGTGIFTSAGGVTTSIALSTDPLFSGFDTPSINTAGTVAFFATRYAGAGGGSGIFTSTGGATTSIALSTDPTFSSFGQTVSINTAGTVAFSATLDVGAGGGDGVFTGAGGATTTIALSTGPTFSSFGTHPSINTAGTVAFEAGRDPGAGGGTGIFTGAGGATTVIALAPDRAISTPTIFDAFGNSAWINTAGQVAFQAVLDAGAEGIYLGDGGAGTRVIGTGDTLNGSTVTALSFARGGMNDAGQLAFGYVLADGSSGLAVASPVPEPTSAALLLGSGLLLLARRRRTA